MTDGLLSSGGGILDAFKNWGQWSPDQDKNSAINNGLLHAAFALMGNKSPNLGQAIGQAGLVGVNGYERAMSQNALLKREAMDRQMDQVRLDSAKNLQEQEAQRRALIQQYSRTPAQTALAGGGGPTIANAEQLPTAGPSFDFTGYAKALAGVDPAQSLQMQAALRKDVLPPVKVGAGEALWDPTTHKQIFTNPKEQDQPSAVREYQFAKQQGYAGTFQQFVLEQKKAGASSVSVDMRGDNEYSKAQGKEYSDIMAGINKAGFQAPSQIRKLERMTELLDGVDGGKLSPVGLDVASWANSVGIKLDPRLGNKEAAQALARDIAGGFRQPGTGPMTDKDFENFLTQVPDLSKSAIGRKQISATMKAAMNRDVQVSKMARDYERKHGRIDGGFMDEVAAFIAENPVVGAPAGWVVKR